MVRLIKMIAWIALSATLLDVLPAPADIPVPGLVEMLSIFKHFH